MFQWVSCFQNIIFLKRFSVNSCLLAHVIFIVKAKILLPYLWKTRKRWLWLLTSKHTLFYIVIWLGVGERYTIYCQFIAFELSKSRIFQGWRRVWDLRYACTQNLVARPIYNMQCIGISKHIIQYSQWRWPVCFNSSYSWVHLYV